MNSKANPFCISRYSIKMVSRSSGHGALTVTPITSSLTI
ncbi:Uncharacterised protein [Vibrio cholerae]|nr:Uncharacterised protein [Vibrio cholerae]